MPGTPALPVVTNSYAFLHARLRVRRHPAFPTPFSGETSCTTRTHSRRENADTRASSAPTRGVATPQPSLVVPAHAGTHNHSEQFWPMPSTSISQHRQHSVWVPACAGTTLSSRPPLTTHNSPLTIRRPRARGDP